MTTLQSIKNQLRQVRGSRPGRWIVLFGDEPEPPHRPGDTVIRFGERYRNV